MENKLKKLYELFVIGIITEQTLIEMEKKILEADSALCERETRKKNQMLRFFSSVENENELKKIINCTFNSK